MAAPRAKIRDYELLQPDVYDAVLENVEEPIQATVRTGNGGLSL